MGYQNYFIPEIGRGIPLSAQRQNYIIHKKKNLYTIVKEFHAIIFT